MLAGTTATTRGAPVVTKRKRLRSNEVALIGIVLLAGGIAVLASGPRLPDRFPLAGALWAGALAMFAAARHPTRQR
jgi:hypothetical protein